MARANPFRWLAGGELRRTPPTAEEVVARGGPKPRIKKNVKKKEASFAAEQLVDAEVIKTPYGDVNAVAGQWVVYFGGDAIVMSDADYRTNYEEVL